MLGRLIRSVVIRANVSITGQLLRRSATGRCLLCGSERATPVREAAIIDIGCASGRPVKSGIGHRSFAVYIG